MKIEIDKTYEINSYRKKSLFEIEQYEHGDGRKLGTEVMWRNGTFYIKVCNEEEAEMLQSCEGEHGEVWDFCSWEAIEVDNCFDGCSEDFVHIGNHFTEQEMTALEKEYEGQLEDDDCMGRSLWLEDRGFESDGCNWQIYGGLEVIESDHEIAV